MGEGGGKGRGRCVKEVERAGWVKEVERGGGWRNLPH